MPPVVIAQTGPDDLHLTAAQYRFLTGQEVITNKPTLTAISPTTKVAGSGGFTLTVTGTNFVTGGVSKIYWGPDPVPTTWVSATSMTAAIDAAKIAAAGTVPITVISGSLQTQSINLEITAAELAAEPEIIEPDPEPIPDSTWLKADIVGWLLDKGVDLDEAALNNLTKTELLSLAADVLSPVEEPA